MLKITLQDQLDELRVYFDNEHVYNLFKELDKLTQFEFIRVKTIIKHEKEDSVYVVSNRLSIQLMNGFAYIVKNVKHGIKLK